MREYKRAKVSPSRMRLMRGADGRLRSQTGGQDIGDVWAEQKRIQLAEAIEADQQRREKRKQGWKRFLPAAIKRLARAKSSGNKEIVLSIDITKLLPKKMPSLKLPKSRKLRYGGLGVMLLVVLGFVGLQVFTGQSASEKDAQKLAASKVLASKHQLPTYQTVTPNGKSIVELGGWFRVSPPDKDPVFAYADTIGAIPITVSQQPLPEVFQKDRAGQMAKLAEQFSASEQLEVEGTTAYLGTSIKGPQSIILAKDDLLILIKSEASIPKEQWIDYIASLRN